MQHYFEDLVPVQVRLRYSSTIVFIIGIPTCTIERCVAAHNTSFVGAKKKLSLKWSLHNLK